MRTTAVAVVTAVVAAPKMLQVKCSVHNAMYSGVYILLLYKSARTAVVVLIVVDAHDEVQCQV